MSTGRFRKAFEFAEKQTAKQLVSGIIYPSDFIDSQGDFALVDDLEKAVITLADNPNMPRVIDVRHDGKATQSKLVESYIAQSDGDYYRTGDWIGTAKISDNEWPLVESGELKAFSLYGPTKREKATLAGKEATRLHDMQVKFISLVPNGANQQYFLSKSLKAPAWFEAWEKKQSVRLQLLEKRYGIGAEGDAFKRAAVGDYVRDADGTWLEKKDGQTFVQVPNTLAVQLEKAHANRSGKKRVRRASEARKPKHKRNASNNRANVAAKTELERHLDYYSALHSIASHNGEYTAQQRADMVDLASAAAQHGGADAVWEGLIDTGPDAYAARNRNNPLKGLG